MKSDSKESNNNKKFDDLFHDNFKNFSFLLLNWTNSEFFYLIQELVVF